MTKQLINHSLDSRKAQSEQKGGKGRRAQQNAGEKCATASEYIASNILKLESFLMHLKAEGYFPIPPLSIFQKCIAEAKHAKLQKNGKILG